MLYSITENLKVTLTNTQEIAMISNDIRFRLINRPFIKFRAAAELRVKKALN